MRRETGSNAVYKFFITLKWPNGQVLRTFGRLHFCVADRQLGNFRVIPRGCPTTIFFGFVDHYRSNQCKIENSVLTTSVISWDTTQCQTQRQCVEIDWAPTYDLCDSKPTSFHSKRADTLGRNRVSSEWQAVLERSKVKLNTTSKHCRS